MKKKILIIGSNGYIGNELKNFLYKKNLEITCVDNLLYGNTEVKEKSKLRFRTLIKDIRELKESFIEKFDTVYCLAALSNNPIKKKNQKQSYDIVKNYTIKLADKIERIGNQLIFPSSCSVYGKNKKNILFNEKSKTNPLTHYSINKLEIENYLKNKHNINKNFKCVILRPATVFGASRSIRFDIVINMLIGMANSYNKLILNSDGSAMRPFIYIEDLCNYFYKSIFVKNNFCTFNCGFNNFNSSIIEIAKLISVITKSKIVFLNQNSSSLHKDDLIKNNKDERSYKVDFSLAKQILKIKPKNNLKNSIIKTNYDVRKILDTNNFESKNFYRLNKMKYLIKKNYINSLSLRNKTLNKQN